MPGPLQEHMNPAENAYMCVIIISTKKPFFILFYHYQLYIQAFLDLHSMLVCAVMAYTLYATIVRNVTFENL